MERYYGWGLLFWPLFFFFFLWAFSWPRRYLARNYHSNHHHSEYDSDGFFRWDQDGKSRGKGPRGYRRSDARITEDVNDRLFVNGEVDASGIEVRVNNGTVVLTGNTNSRREKRLAEWISDTVPGVQNVENRIAIGSPQTTEVMRPATAQT